MVFYQLERVWGVLQGGKSPKDKIWVLRSDIFFGLGGSYFFFDFARRLFFSASWSLTVSSSVPGYIESLENPICIFFYVKVMKRSHFFLSKISFSGFCPYFHGRAHQGNFFFFDFRVTPPYKWHKPKVALGRPKKVQNKIDNALCYILCQHTPSSFKGREVCWNYSNSVRSEVMLPLGGSSSELVELKLQLALLLVELGGSIPYLNLEELGLRLPPTPS